MDYLLHESKSFYTRVVLFICVQLGDHKNPPTNPRDLIDNCAKDWKPESVSRKQRTRAIKQFLDHAVNREGIADVYTPSTYLKQHIDEAKRKILSIKKLPYLKVIYKY